MADGALGRFIGAFASAFLRAARPQRRTSAPTRSTAPAAPRGAGAAILAEQESPGQYGEGATRDLAAAEIRALRISYAPDPDGDPDPGEIVWTWVPYVENDGRGKDRPVLIVARTADGAVAGCYLSTKEHRGFVSIGRGAWDAQGRESFLAPDRLLRVTDRGMRREGHVLPRDRFDGAAAAIARLHGIG